ncbi:MAG TPA: YbjN domain-containing protein [Kofleriaceae bacterium]|nr:YbjN domain-containing protein [Kofleriaceae bacterium]
MTPAELATAQRIESALAGNPAFRKLDDRVYVVKQGSTFVMLNIAPIDDTRAQVRCVAQLVKGVDMTLELALELLSMNTRLRFGSFAYAAPASLVLITHSLLGGDTLDTEEVLATLADLAVMADQWDDHIISRFGGQRMQDLLDKSAIGKLFADPNSDAFRS